MFPHMHDVIHRDIRLKWPNAYGRAKLPTRPGKVRSVARITLARVAMMVLAGISIQQNAAGGQGSTEAAAQGGATMTQGSPATASGGVVRTPADIERDRDIVPPADAPQEVPNPPTVPLDEYRKLKQDSGRNAPGNQQAGPARK
jgi:hypothetical protein